MTSSPAHYRVRNWSQYQHYKDRSPAWIKLHFALLASEDWVMLSDASRLLAVVCMLVASRHDGSVPNNPAYIRRVAYLDSLPDLAPLISCGFLVETLADDSAMLARASAAQADATECLSREEESREEESREEESREEESREEERRYPSGSEVAPAGNVDRDEPTLEAKVYALGKTVLGKSSGGVITKLRRHCNGDLGEVISLLTLAQEKASPIEWVSAVLRGDRDAERERREAEIYASLQ